jgi:RNA ligase
MSRARAKLKDVLDIELLQDHIANHNIVMRIHPENPALAIFNYTAKCMYSGAWDDVTTKCRGLIIEMPVDCRHRYNIGDSEVIARPWRKFFSLTQLKDETESGGSGSWGYIDDEMAELGSIERVDVDRISQVEVTDKIDGSMLILYQAPDGNLAFSTRGSFESEQAKFYSDLIRKSWSASLKSMLWGRLFDYTLIFEGIGPANRIVLEYPDNEIVFIGATETVTGRYKSITDFPEMNQYGVKTATIFPELYLSDAVKIPPRPNAEGVVVRYIDKDVMYKVKQDDYLALSREINALQNITNKRVWEYMCDIHLEQITQSELEDTLRDNLPEDMVKKVLDILCDMEDEYKQIFEDAKHQTNLADDRSHDKKSFAMAVADRKYPMCSQVPPALLFAIHDGKTDVADKIILKMLTPKEVIRIGTVMESNRRGNDTRSIDDKE